MNIPIADITRFSILLDHVGMNIDNYSDNHLDELKTCDGNCNWFGNSVAHGSESIVSVHECCA